MTDHCFISYSATDGLEFATKLADELQGRHPNIHIWFDKREMDASIVDWDDQLANAIKACKCLVFVMTPDSVAKGSTCKEEWTWALKYKKPVICLLKDKKAEVPFRLNNRQYIDISTDFESGIAQLRTAIKRLDEPEGILEELDRRLSQAKRDLQRTPHEEEKPRIQAEIEELNKQIEAQQKIVDNPKKAEEQTQKNIDAGLERERQPEKPVAGKTSTRFINPPPGIAPNYFQDRLIETKQITDFLNNDSQRLMTIVGRAGVGKTAMVCRLLKALERGELPDDLGEMKVDGIVYLSETGSHRVNFANVFADLIKLLPRETAERLEGIYKNPQTSTGDKIRALLDAFPSGRVILLLDNFETLIDPESLNLRDSELSDALNALLGGQHHAVKAVITTRIAPRDLAISEPGRQHHLSLDEGLESPYAENVLREMDADGRVGLKTAPDALLNKAREKTRGYPRALEALYAILSVDRYTTLEELLELSLPDEVVQKLVGEAFNRLDTSAQKVMQALAVYNRPVSPAAIDYLLQPHLPSIDSALVLNRLVNMHFARKDAGKYYLHSADKDYALSTIPEGSTDDKLRLKSGIEFFNYCGEILTKYPDLLENQETFQQASQKENADLLTELVKTVQNLEPTLAEKMQDEKNFEDEAFLADLDQAFKIPQVWTRYALTFRAADYFAQARKPRAEWKKLDDLTAQLAEFDLRCEAGDYDTAESVLSEIGDLIGIWGHYLIQVNLELRTYKRIQDNDMIMSNLIGLGNCFHSMGKVRDGILYYEEGLVVAQKLQSQSRGSHFLWGLANCYATLGDTRKAIEFYEQALVIAREIGDRSGEGINLGNLGSAYTTLGDTRKAIELIEQSLVIVREIGDRSSEGSTLSNLGHAYGNLGDTHKAIEFYEQALVIAREIGDRSGEAYIYNFIGAVFDKSGNVPIAIEYFEKVLAIAREIDSHQLEGTALSNIALQYMNLGNPLKSIEYYQQALQNAREIGNKYGESKRLNGLAGVLIEKGDLQNAINHSQEALQIGQEMSDPEVCIESSDTLAQALLFFEKLKDALRIVKDAEKYNSPIFIFNISVLHGIIALRQGEKETAQEAFMKSIAQADEILAKTPDYYSALDAKGLSICGLAILSSYTDRTDSTESSLKKRKKSVPSVESVYKNDAIETFKKARKIAPHAGVVKSVLRLFDELVKCDEEGILKDVRKAAEGVE